MFDGCVDDGCVDDGPDCVNVRKRLLDVFYGIYTSVTQRPCMDVATTSTATYSCYVVWVGIAVR
jgi:hypothetical protein